MHHVYDWDPSIFSIMNTSQFLAGIVITFTLVPVLLRVFKFRDFTLGIIGSISMMGKNLFFAFSAHHTYIYYAGNIDEIHFDFVFVYFSRGYKSTSRGITGLRDIGAVEGGCVHVHS